MVRMGGQERAGGQEGGWTGGQGGQVGGQGRCIVGRAKRTSRGIVRGSNSHGERGGQQQTGIRWVAGGP